MKFSISFLVFFSILLISCTDQASDPSGSWIGPIQKNSNENHVQSNYVRPHSIYTINQDRFSLHYFPSFALLDSTKVIQGKFQDGKLYFKNQELGQISSCQGDAMQLNLRETHTTYTSMNFDRISPFKQADNKKKILNLLLNNNFIFGPRAIEIEFHPKELLITKGLNYPLRKNLNWKLININKELFLLIGIDVANAGYLFHIKDFDDTGIQGRIYGLSDRLVKLSIVPSRPNHDANITDLFGTWKSMQQVHATAIRSKSKNKPLQTEQLIISEDYIISSGVNLDTFPYLTNRHVDQLIFPHAITDRQDRKWNILSLTPDSLVIRRFPKAPPYAPKPPENVVFLRE